MDAEIKDKKPAYERIGVLSLEEVFPHIEKHFYDFGKRKVQIREFYVNVQSLRLKTFFRSGVQCPCCTNKGSFFAVERSYGSLGGYHINLYGVDAENNEVLFTHDHIIARGLGGEDNIGNSRTMCGPCNWEKGKLEGIIKKSFSSEETQEAQEQLKKFMP
jgi:hypothetical protein